MQNAHETISSQVRTLKEEERELISAMLVGVSGQDLPGMLDGSRVKDIQDGGMGSIRFVHSDRRVLGKVLKESRYRDADGVLVSISLNTDERGDLFELDFWKVDFSPLRRYPTPSDLQEETAL